MNVGLMQPAFMPWQGFFELICRSDVFVFLDDFQFSVQSYHQRNRLFVNTGQVGWYNVAVEKSSFKMPMNKAVINEQKLPSFIKWFRKRAIAAGIAENQDALYPIFTELIREEDDRVPPFLDLVKEKEAAGALVAVRKVRNSSLVFLIIQREGRKESFPISKSAASQIPVGSEIKICRGEKGFETYWRPRVLSGGDPKAPKGKKVGNKKS